jgi:hypothetical protein
MPKKRVKSKRKTTRLTWNQLIDLLLLDQLDKHDPKRTFTDEAHRKQVWEEHKEAIIKEQIECGQLHMPGAWWQYDSGLGRWPKDTKEERKYLSANIWLTQNGKKANSTAQQDHNSP